MSGILYEKENSNSRLKKLMTTAKRNLGSFVCFVWLVGFLTSSSTTRLYCGRAPRQERLTILRAATHETELGDHDFCLNRSHYTDTDPTSRERAATAGIEPGTSSPGVARSTDWATAPPTLAERNVDAVLRLLGVFHASYTETRPQPWQHQCATFIAITIP